MILVSKPAGRNIGLPSVAQILTTASALLAALLPSLANGGNQATGPTVFEPSGEGVVTYYSAGRPFGVFSRSGLSFIVELENASVASAGYARLWVYCRNDSVPFVDFDPSGWLRHSIATQQQLKLNFSPAKGVKYTILPLDASVNPSYGPEPAWSLMNRVKAQASREELWSILSAGISGLSSVLRGEPTQNVTWQSNGAVGSGSMTIHESSAQSEARAEIRASRLATEFEQIQGTARADQTALNQSVLRRDTLVPGMAVAGFVYFPEIKSVEGRVLVERLNSSKAAADTILQSVAIDYDASEHVIRVTLPTGDGISLRFVAVAAR